MRLSIFISIFTQLDAQNLFHSKFYFMALHVLAHVRIIRRSKLHYTASGIITPIGVLIIRRSKLHYANSGNITPIGVMIPEAV